MAEHLWIISDLHMADKSHRDKFGPKCEELLIAELSRLQAIEGRHTFVHNGDVFDLLKIPGKRKDSGQDIERLDAAMKAYSALFDAWQAFVARGHELVWILGNHDAPLHNLNFHDRLLQRISRTGSGGRLEGFRIVAEYYEPGFRLLAQHGQRFDDDNDYGLDGQAPFGNYMVEEVLNKWEDFVLDGERPFGLIDNIRPYSFLPRYIAGLIRQNPKYAEVRDELLRDIARVMCEHGRQLPGHLLATLSRVDGSVPGLRKLVDELLEVESTVDYTKYHDAARSLLAAPSRFWGPDERPEHVVLGHTHYVDRAPIEVGAAMLGLHRHRATYYNTGTWLENVFIEKDGSPGPTDRLCPVLRFERDGDGVRHSFYSASNNEPIDVEALRRFYELHSIHVGA